MEEDWDLMAIVRSCSAATTAPGFAAKSADDNSPLEDPLTCDRNGSSFSFTSFIERNMDHFDELQEICKPIYPNAQPIEPQQKQRSPSSQQKKFGVTIQENNHFEDPRPRRRKNQLKKTVLQLAENKLSDDVWAWRKYGQKPIKGSPYPRNYYRCSSTKQCSARKQVERSHVDPNVFIVSYAGDHSHPVPTHRNTLAGSTRNKSLSKSCSSSSVSAASLSPTTPLPVFLEEEMSKSNNEKLLEEEEDEGEEEDEEDILIPNIAMREVMFVGSHEIAEASCFPSVSPVLEIEQKFKC